MATEAPLPEAFGRLLARLEREGFEVALDKYYPQVFGDRVVELRRRRRRVRLVRDRGQWRVDLRVAGEWIEPQFLVAARDRRPPRRDVPPPEDAAALAMDALARMPSDPLRRLILRIRAEIVG